MDGQQSKKALEWDMNVNMNMERKGEGEREREYTDSASAPFFVGRRSSAGIPTADRGP